MSNNTLLITSPGPTKPGFRERPSGSGLLMAATSIPVFWYALFDESCLALGPTPDDNARQYLHLTTPTADGLARAEGRWPMLAAVIGRQLKVLFHTWLGYVRDNADAYVHCETLELWWMFETDEEFEAELRLCLSAFRHPPAGSGKDVAWDSSWYHLLGQAHVSGSRKDGLKPLGNLSYCGWDGPWSDDSTAVCGTLRDEAIKAPTFGERPEDLLGYLEYARSPMYEVRPSICRCGANVFRLRYQKGSGAQRICVHCEKNHFVLKSREFWASEDAMGKTLSWACEGCGGDEANLAVGCESDSSEQFTQFVSVGQRCVQCGRMGSCVSWEEWARLDEMDDSLNEAWWLVNDGYDLAAEGKYAEAMARYRAAWDELPEPRDRERPDGDILDLMADSLCHLGVAPRCEGNDELTRQRGRGLALFELGEVDAAVEALRPLYHENGPRLFDGVAPRYREALLPRLESMPHG